VIPKRFVIAASLCLATATIWPSEALAQRRGARVRPVRSVVVVGAGFYNPYFFSSPFWGGWYPGFGYGPYPFYAPYGYGYGGYGYGYGPAIAEARLQIKPNDAEVFVDGYYVGRVNSFDGVFQRLDLPPGEHELVVYRDGYRTYRQKNLFRPGEGYKYQAVLEPLGPGEAQEPRPKASSTPPAQQSPYQEPGPSPRGLERGRTMPLPERHGSDRPESGGFGTLNVRVQPADATVTIDGERWDSPEGGSRLQVQLSAGRHRIEVRKEGFKPYSTSVDIRAGETETVNVSLPSAGAGAL
jgi:PEGA domain